MTTLEIQVRDLATWTIFQNDGPDHLGLRWNAFPAHQMAIFTTGCVHSDRLQQARQEAPQDIRQVVRGRLELCLLSPLPSWLRHRIRLLSPLPSWLRHRLFLLSPLPSWLRHRLCLVFALPSQQEHRPCLVCSTAFAAQTPHSPCVCQCLRSKNTAFDQCLPLPSQQKHCLYLLCSPLPPLTPHRLSTAVQVRG